MNYILKQYSYKNGDFPKSFVTPVHIDILNKRICPYNLYEKDTTVTRTTSDGTGAYEQYKSLQPYYFCGVIKRQVDSQVINIKLANADDDPTNADTKTQFIKTITIPSGASTLSYFVEFIFKPVADFDSILFESTSGSPAIVGCIDMLQINNIVNDSSYLNATGSLIRFSIQSVPGFLMEINGEEIRIPHNGIYEIKNGIILVNSFAPVVHCQEDINFRNQKEGQGTSNQVNSYMTASRDFNSFTVDYLYYKIEE